MIEPKIDDLLARVDSKYTLVILAARRARQINGYYSQLGEGIGEFVPPTPTARPSRSPSRSWSRTS
jgi:DNA-directed RNA polymerase subunit omega